MSYYEYEAEQGTVYIRPIKNHVAVQVIESDSKTVAGVIMPVGLKKDEFAPPTRMMRYAKVLAVGEDVGDSIMCGETVCFAQDATAFILNDTPAGRFCKIDGVELPDIILLEDRFLIASVKVKASKDAALCST